MVGLRILTVLLVLSVTSAGVVGATNVVPLDADGLTVLQEFRAGTSPLTADTDGDGLSDDRELEYSDPTNVDTDGDGLDDGREATLGTDPAVADSDSDGLDDMREADGPTDPTMADTDGDGINDNVEIDGPTDPTVADTDGDSLDDGVEIDGESDPTVADTDGDGLDDGREVKLGTNPTEIDTDGDGLTDGDEELEYNFNPKNADMDDDGLDDGEEVDIGLNAYSPDVDADGLEDGKEIEFGTDPKDEDTDGDNLLDGWEVAGETDGGATLPDADPLRMNLYIQIDHGENTNPLSAAGEETVIEAFADWGVENPDGSTGVSVHINERRVDDRLVIHSEEDYDDLKRTYKTSSHLGERLDVYHLVMIAVSHSKYGGLAERGGTFSFVDDQYGDDRPRVLIHELLHNLMGLLDPENQCGDDKVHTCDGWLSTFFELHWPDGLAKEVEENGFEDR